MAQNPDNPTDPAMTPADAEAASQQPGAGFAVRLVAGVLALALAFAAAIGYARWVQPPPTTVALEAVTDYPRQSMRQALAADSLHETTRQILDLGESRYPGTPGHRAAQQHLARWIPENGMRLHRLPFQAAAPVTEHARILNAAGEPLEAVGLWPMLPNQLQPMVTPAEGLRGELVVVSEEVIEESESFDGRIAVVDAAAAPDLYGTDWSSYARLGFEAVIVTHRDGIEAVDWGGHDIAAMVDATPINFVRLAASPAILDHDGESVTLRVRTSYRNVQADMLIGQIVAGPNPEADRGGKSLLVIHTPYDAASYTPDLAAGTAQAANLAIAQRVAATLAQRPENLQRDVMLIATGARAVGDQDLIRMMSVIGPPGEGPVTRGKLAEQRDEHRQRLDDLAGILEALEDPDFLVDLSATEDAMAAFEGRADDYFAEEIRFVINERLIEFGEVLLEEQLDFIRAGEDPTSEAFYTYQRIKRRYETISSIAGYPPDQVVERWNRDEQLSSNLDLRPLAERRFEKLAAYHRRALEQVEAELAFHDLVIGYERISVVTPVAAPTAGAADEPRARLTFTPGSLSAYDGTAISESVRDTGPVFSEIFRRAGETEAAAHPRAYEIMSYSRGHTRRVGRMQMTAPMGPEVWNAYGYPAAGLIHQDRLDTYRAIAAPTDTWDRDAARSVEAIAGVFGEAAQAMAYGAGEFPTGRSPSVTDFHGRVFAAAMGSSIVPTHPLTEAIVFEAPNPEYFVYNGHIRIPLQRVDPYGRYRFSNVKAGLVNLGGARGTHPGWSPVAVRHLDTGLIGHVTDAGSQGQSTYRSMNLAVTADVITGNIVTFRAAPLAVTDVINPQTLESFSSIQVVNHESLSPLSSFLYFPQTTASHDAGMAFVPPQERVFLLFRAGSAENELVQTIRAFSLNVMDQDLEPYRDSPREVVGPGFLVADHPLVDDVARRIATSMKWVNDRRLELQQEYHLADDRTEAFQARSGELLEAAAEPGLSRIDARLHNQGAAVYQILNHPVLRGTIREAVLSILWYLALIVPFSFFFEKLAFGMPDVRKQLGVASIIFLISFGLLALLHPAFEMVQSTLMILLGFIIMLISLGVLVLFTGKFGENLDYIRQARGVVSEADVNKLGVVGTAFMLGLNNMHRRKVRTGLTCTTLVLITFAMIAFTSVQNDLVERQLALGKAAYQGFLVKKENLRPISASQVDALRAKYGRRFNVAPREMVVGTIDYRNNMHIPTLALSWAEMGTRVDLLSMLVFARHEPLRDELEYTTRSQWFGDATEDTDAQAAMVLPESVASRLRIDAEDVDAGGVEVRVNNRPYRVTSIVTDESLLRLRGLDRNDVLPFNVEAMTQAQMQGASVLAMEPYVRVQPSNLVIASDVAGLALGGGELRTTSVAVELINAEGAPLPYKPANTEIQQYLEQTGEPAYYGLDGVAYAGERSRQQQLSGLVDMLIPLVIAALTVLNTMRGSVYERRDEIYVYNAVGIAPRYVFFMFFAEALVYSVVGSVLGYLLSQGTGRVLTELGWTGGLNMTFASLSTVLASLAITGAVFVSTLFPALSAMRIASPAEDAGWTLPEAEGDEMAMQLPFTFDRRDRMAVMEFLTRIFLDHGEGASGSFFAGLPDMGLRRTGGGGSSGEGGEGEALPVLGVTVWLKPLDLGVSQRLEVSMPEDPESGGYIAELTLTRLSGTRESWLRLNKTFLAGLRRNFLHWRAMGEPQRASMFVEAKQRMERQIRETGETLG